MNRRTQQLVDDLARARPIPPDATGRVAPPPVRRAMFERITDPSVLRPAPSRPRRRVPGRLLPLTAATAAFVVVAALAIGLLPGRGPGSAPPAGALEVAARTAAAQPYREPGPGERWYQQQEAVGPQAGGTREGASTEVWWSSDGKAWSRSTSSAGTSPIEPGDGRFFGFDSTLSFERARGLPTDPAALRGELERMLPEDEELAATLPQETAVAFQALELLANPALRPEQRAALYRVVAAAPGVRVLTGVTDPAGHQAVAVEFAPDEGAGIPERFQFLFDPASSAVTGFRLVAQRDDPELGVRKGEPYDAIAVGPWRIVPDPLG